MWMPSSRSELRRRLSRSPVRSTRWRRWTTAEKTESDHRQGTAELHSGGQQRRRVHQDHAGLRRSANGTSNTANYTGQTIGINGNGDSGSQSPLNNAYSYNGLPGNSLDITADGAHVSDPGCNCDTPVNPNSDMISEIQVKMSNFSAENQKGPAVITSVAKSGGKDFHGSAFFYARNYALNANDALFNASGETAAGEQVLLSRRHLWRSGTDPRHAFQ